MVHPSVARLNDGPKRLPNADLFRLLLGVNAAHREVYWSFINQTLVMIGGKVGMGKTQVVHEYLCQLAGFPWVQFVMLDGKEGYTYSAWSDRTWLTSDRDLANAIRALKAVNRYIKKRADAYYAEFGRYNIWDARPDGSGGPTEKYPLIVIVWEEVQIFLSHLVGSEFGRNKVREQQVGEIFELALTLVNAGRDFGILNFMITQYAKADAVPSLISNQIGTGVCLGVLTPHAAASILTSRIWESDARDVSPVGKIGDQDRGAATVLLPQPKGGLPYERVRVPYASGDFIKQTVSETSVFNVDPFTRLM